MPELCEEEIAELIAVLAPPPDHWVRAASELPRAREAIEGLTAQAIADQCARKAILADLEQALRGAGVEPRAALVESLRVRLSGLD